MTWWVWLGMPQSYAFSRRVSVHGEFQNSSAFAFSIGTETLGSIVEPSGVCGVTSLRPTFGRVSRHGVMALSWSLDKIGPMCRSVEDCAVVLNAVQRPDDRDLAVRDVPFNWDASVDIRELRSWLPEGRVQRHETDPTDRCERRRGVGAVAILRHLARRDGPARTHACGRFARALR